MNKTFAIVANSYDSSKSIVSELNKFLKSQNFKQSKTPSLVFCIGGDGTFLKAFHQFEKQLADVTFITVKSGNLGFYSNFTESQLNTLFQTIISNKWSTINFDYLKVNVNKKNYFAINEANIIHSGKPVEFDIKINNQLLESFKGTGYAISTSSGSTGFTRSNNGAIVFPNTNTYLLMPLFPCTNINRQQINSQIVLDAKSNISFSKFSNSVELVIDTKPILVKASETVNMQLISKAVSIMKNPIDSDSFVNKLNRYFVKVG